MRMRYISWLGAGLIAALASHGALAAPQILAVLGTDGAIPLICADGHCQADISTYCLQRDRLAPDYGTAYVPAATGSFTLDLGQVSGDDTAGCIFYFALRPLPERNGRYTVFGRIIEGAADGFRVWSGADEDTLPILALGGYGVISVVSHLVGRQLREMIDAAVAGRAEEAGRIHRRLQPLIASMFVVSNPVPLKYAMGQLGFSVGGVRLPLCEPDADTGELVMAEVRRHQIDLPVTV